MAFQPEQPIAPVRRRAVSIVFYIPDPEADPPEQQYGVLEVQIEYSDGKIEQKKFDLLARLQDDAEGQQLLTGLGQLKTYLIDRIESELLP